MPEAMKPYPPHTQIHVELELRHCYKIPACAGVTSPATEVLPVRRTRPGYSQQTLFQVLFAALIGQRFEKCGEIADLLLG